MTKAPDDFQGLNFLPTIFLKFFSLRIKAFILINSEFTSTYLTDIVVGNWHRASKSVTDITDQPSLTGNESAPKSSHVLLRHISKRSGRDRV